MCVDDDDDVYGAFFFLAVVAGTNELELAQRTHKEDGGIGRKSPGGRAGSGVVRQ